MVFSSLLFLFRFLPLALLFYYAAPGKLRNFVLFAASIFFYAWGEPVYVILILVSTIVDYTTGRLTGYYLERGKRKQARMAVAGSVVVNLALLGFFKYADFFLRTISGVFSLEMPVMDLALPIGISFYTFQTMSYTIDVYRREAKVQKNLITFGAYVSLFPQLIAGPIVRYWSVADQMDHRRESADGFFYGMMRFMTGLGKKVLLANQTGRIWEEIAASGAGQLSTATAWLGILAFTLQIYFDFSGYSDMAIGLGAMFGFSFPENFDYPYESASITEFWRRWHISLGTWFREYVYIPLGGNRKGPLRQMVNLAAVWLLTGLWHGAYWNFVLWGVYYGILLVLEKCLWKYLERLPGWLRHLYTMAAVVTGWSLFSWQDMADSAGYMKALWFHGQAGLADQRALFVLASNGGFFILAAIGSTSLVKRVIVERCLPQGTARRDVAGIFLMVTLFMACLAMLVNSSYNPFLYFRF